MREGVQVRDITNEEGNRLLRIVRRSSGSVVTWRRAHMVLLSAQGMDVAMIAKVTFTSPDRVREVLHNFNEDRFQSPTPATRAAAHRRSPSRNRREIKRIALSRPTDHDPALLDVEPVEAGRVPRRRGGGRRHQPRGPARFAPRGGVSFQRLKTWKVSNDPDFEAKKNRILELYEIADGKREPTAAIPAW